MTFHSRDIHTVVSDSLDMICPPVVVQVHLFLSSSIYQGRCRRDLARAVESVSNQWF